jgi:hypothetical protein
MAVQAGQAKGNAASRDRHGAVLRVHSAHLWQICHVCFDRAKVALRMIDRHGNGRE